MEKSSPSSEEGAITRCPLRVRFCETDLMGIVHHANYILYFEAGRIEWLRRRGVSYAGLVAKGVHLPVIETGVRHKAPARFDDLLVVETRLAQLRLVSVRFEVRILRDDVELATGFTRLACVDNDHALRRIPEELAVVLGSPEI